MDRDRDRWHKNNEEVRSYNTVDDQKEYEDPDYFYGGIGSPTSHTSVHRMPPQVVNSPPPPPPPLMNMKPTHLAIHNNKKTTSRWRTFCVSLALAAACLVLITSIVAFLVLGNRAQTLFQNQQQQPYILAPGHDINQPPKRRTDMDITANHLLTLLITKRKICLFEAGTADDVISRSSFIQDHIESARILYHSNLSHAGVPVHPLQFQRYARQMGVDNDCHVIIYDRGQMIWSTYAAWVFKLFGHQRVSLLSGGYLGWKTQQGRSSQYRTDAGEAGQARTGDFVSSWNNSMIITYDDVFLNSEIGSYDVVDAQTKEEFHGVASGALYGHIRGANNLPVDAVYNWGTGLWTTNTDLERIFSNVGLSPSRPVIVYCSTSLRSSMIWWALSRLGYKAKIYFGGWPEWVVRAPDELKVLNTST